ncbi:MAG TPA: peptide chain release factor 3 [Planctomycetes bacterium]|nr:peptide chain release factor 3 [Planctomycetota bacterium]
MDTDLDPILTRETARRRTFAIISHPDAGKTTLTEKLLLYSGLLRTAGMVKNRKGGKLATSDWMTMEQERGISITSSAMQFEYHGHVINVLDTPGHQDFSADTYRTLTAADCAIMVLDAAKGVETQTRKLFAVCKLRGIPVLTFINKLDLPSRSPLELMAEVEEVLGIAASAINWPVGSGREFVGVADRAAKDLVLFEKTSVGGAQRASMQRLPLASPEAQAAIPEDLRRQLAEDLEMLEIAGNPFSREAFLGSRITPVFFGSALTNFGIEPFFDAFVELAPAPSSREVVTTTGSESMDPIAAPFSAYVFKIQANMNPKHRDQMAFIRICSGRFERDLVVKHVRAGQVLREVRLSRPQTLVARDRNTLDEAFPGDVVGLINAGFAIGDTLAVKGGFEHQALPQFPPEHFARIEPSDLTKRKGFDKGMETLAGEGAVQVLRSYDNPIANPFIAAVGRLQFEVLQFRLKDEWNVETTLTPLPYACSGWLHGDIETFKPTPGAQVAKDARGRIVVLFPSEWDRQYCLRQNPEHQLLDFA